MQYKGESASWITWLPIALAGIGFNLWILWYLLVDWLGLTGQPVPVLGYLISGASVLVIVAFFGYIFKGMFGESPARKGGICI